MLKYLELTRARKFEYTWLIKIVFSIALMALLYYQFRIKIPVSLPYNQFISSLNPASLALVLLVLFLMTINWGIEALKWKILVNEIEPQSFVQSFKSVLSGVASSMFLPNRTGEFFGRMMYVKKEARLKIVSLSVYSGIAQWIATITLGSISFVLSFNLSHPVIADLLFCQLLFYIVPGIILLSLMVYFSMGSILSFVKKIEVLRNFVSKFELEKISIALSLKLLTLSFLRYFVFVLQYFLLLRAFNITLSVEEGFVLIPLNLLVITLIPTVTLSEIGVRGNVALFFLIPYTNNEWGIVFTVLAIWVINLVIPALVGGALILQIKPSNKSYEKTFA